MSRLAWRRRRAQSLLSAEDTRVVWRLVSELIDYPTQSLRERIPAMAKEISALPPIAAEPLARCVEHLSTVDLQALQMQYVETFDTQRRCCLHLTYAYHGDTRRRGVALVQFKQAYRRAGLDFQSDELPDHLAVVLDFGVHGDLLTALRLVADHRASVELLRLALQDKGSGWSGAVEAVCASLPPLEGEERAAVAALIAAGPPDEDVGLEPYAIDPALHEGPYSAHVEGATR